MPLSTEVHEARIRVRYAETDAAGIAHHAAFLPWLEVGRVEWLRSMGVSYVELERQGFTLPVVELRMRYAAPARFDQSLLVRTALTDMRSRSVRFVYEVVTDEEHPRQLANGMSLHLCLKSGAVAPLPVAIKELAE